MVCRSRRALRRACLGALSAAAAAGCQHRAVKPAGEAIAALRSEIEAARGECVDTYAPDQYLAAQRRLAQAQLALDAGSAMRSSREIARAGSELEAARAASLTARDDARERTAEAIAAARTTIEAADADGADDAAPVDMERARLRLEEAETAFAADPCRYPEAAGLANLAAAIAGKARSDALLARTQAEDVAARAAAAASAGRVEAETEARRRESQPPGGRPPAGPAAPVRVDVWIVTPGQSLWRIARDSRVYGDPFLWPLIYHFNRVQIFDPDLIFPGQEFHVPRDLSEEAMSRARREARNRIWPVPGWKGDGR